MTPTLVARNVVLVVAAAIFSLPALVHGQVRPVLGWSPFFPLKPGSQWTYQRKGPAAATQWEVSVAEPAEPEPGVRHVLLSGYFPGVARLVRSDRANAVLETSSWSQHESLWYLLGAPVGTAWVLQLAPLPTMGPVSACVDGAKLRLVSRGESVSVPAGEFTHVVRVDWTTRCRDAGITSEWFAPDVGLVRRVEDSIAGPVVSELVDAVVGELHLPRPAWNTALTLDRPVYVNDLMPALGGPQPLPEVRGSFVLSNATEIPIELRFSGCRSVAIVVRNERGDGVLTAHGDDGGCCTCKNLQVVTLMHGLLALPVRFTLASVTGAPLPSGRYSVEVTLETLDPQPLRPSAAALIEIQNVY
jgi:hypothetical protein